MTTTNSHQKSSNGGIPDGAPVASTTSAHNNHYDEEQQEKQKLGRSCCGCCCDMRRAVIILSALGIAISSLSYLGNVFFLFNLAKEDTTDTSEIERIDNLNIINIIMTCFAALFYTLAIVGAVRFNNRLVLMNAIYVMINFVTITVLFKQASDDIASFDYGVVNTIGPAIGAAMTVYVNMTFYREVKNGIMSEKTYEREKQSCCCVAV